MGVPASSTSFDEKYYTKLPGGGPRKAVGRLFKTTSSSMSTPYQEQPGDPLQTVSSLEVREDLRPLYDYLVKRGSFGPLSTTSPKILPPSFSRDVLKRIARNDPAWEQMVPSKVAKLIRKRGFFRLARLSRRQAPLVPIQGTRPLRAELHREDDRFFYRSPAPETGRHPEWPNPSYQVRSAGKTSAKLAKKQGETGAEAYESQLGGRSARPAGAPDKPGA